MTPSAELHAKLEATAARLKRDRTSLVRYVDVVPRGGQLVRWAKRSQWCCVVHPAGVAWLELADDGGLVLMRAEGFSEAELAAAEVVHVFGEGEIFARGCGCR